MGLKTEAGLYPKERKAFSKRVIAEFWSKNVFHLLVYNYASKRHNKSNSFQGKLEGGQYPIGGGGLIIGCIFWFTGI